jgi:subtilase family serine protease
LRVEELENRVVPSTGLALHPDAFIIPNITGNVSPTSMQAAYGVNNILFGSIKGDGTGQTIALIDAFNQPNIISDLQHFDTSFGLPAPPSFQVLNQNLQASPLPSNNVSWGLEESLDVEWSHVMAPGANIVLIEANSNSDSDLFTASKNAGSIAAQVSMSFGGGESAGETSFDQDFTTPGVTYFASSGDGGRGAQYPAASPNVVGVGGTYLALNSSHQRVGEVGWRGSGGGPSTVESEPAYQQGVQTTGKRTIPDIAADASPSSGVQVYDSFGEGGFIGGVGGTSLASPMWAGIMAIANQGRRLAGKGTLDNMPADLYSLSASNFHDIVKGNNGYAAGPGYDYVTGIGSPVGNVLIPSLVGLTAGVVTHKTATHGTGTGTTVRPNLVVITAVPPVAVSTMVPATAPTAQVTAAVQSTPTIGGVAVGGASATADGPILLAHSAPDAPVDASTAPDAQPDGTAPAAQPATPVPTPGSAVPGMENTTENASFVDRLWWSDGNDSVIAPTAPEGAAIDSAAAAGVLAFLGGAWTAQYAETEARARRRLKA